MDTDSDDFDDFEDLIRENPPKVRKSKINIADRMNILTAANPLFFNRRNKHGILTGCIEVCLLIRVPLKKTSQGLK